jgi:hypothetical protein
MKVSIIIPCYYTHKKYLEELCMLYSNINVYEIIIIISGYNNRDYILKKNNLFNTIIHIEESSYRLYLGQAITEAEKIATGDLLILQAADDYPTIDRVERIVKYFETYDIVVLNHGFFKEDEYIYNKIDTSESHIIQSQQLYETYNKPENIILGYGFGLGFTVISAPCAWRKEIVGKFEWSQKPRGQDHETSRTILKKFNKSMIVSDKLYFYMVSRSTINE